MKDPTLDKFIINKDFIINENGCWIWQKYITKSGYGLINVGNKRYTANRVLYCLSNNLELNIDGHVDHICRNRNCCNPQHNRLVSAKENILAGVGYSALNAQKTCCPKCGGPYTRVKKAKRWLRECKICVKEYKKLYKLRIKNAKK